MVHVLVVEDESLIAVMIEDVLRWSGADSVALAATQDDAVRLARERRPDLITADVNLPQGSGPEAVAAIRREHGRIPVLYITGNPEACRPADEETLILAKPVAPNAVARQFSSLLAGQTNARSDNFRSDA
jgi:CheY-like chemotaxis protein